jgi:hypothetical protein
MFRTILPTFLRRPGSRRVTGLLTLLALLVAVLGSFPLITHASTLGDIVSGTFSLMGSGVSWVVGQALTGIASIVKYIASWILWAGGGVMEASIQYSLEAGFYKLEGVREGWTIIRDVANMVFIFVLVYIGFVTILQLAGFNTKQTLVWLIVMALLVNFSFFLTGVVIDAANILGLFFYNAVTLGGSESISAQIANGLDLETIFDSAAYNQISGIQQAVADFLGAGLMALAGLAFLAAGILFVLRTIALTFVLVLSPLAFVAAILPNTREQFRKWLSALVNHAFVAPVFLLIITIIVRILNEGNLIDNTETYGKVIAADSSDPDVDTLGILVVYAIIIGLLFGAISISRKMSGTVGQYSAKYAGTAAGMAMGAAAFAGRRTIGRGAHELTKREDFKRWARDSGFGEAAYKGAEKASSATMDLRNTQVTKGLENVAKSSGAVEGGFGKAGGKGGYDKIRKNQVERRKQTAEALEKGKSTREAMTDDEASREEDLIRRSQKAQESGLDRAAQRLEKERSELRKGVQDREKAKGAARKEGYAQRLDRGSFFTRKTLQRDAEKQAADQIRKGKSDIDKLVEEVNKRSQSNASSEESSNESSSSSNG